MSRIEIRVTEEDIELGQVSASKPKECDLAMTCAIARAAEREMGISCAIDWWKYPTAGGGAHLSFFKAGIERDGLELRIKGAEDGETLADWLKAHDNHESVEPITVESY